LLIDVDFFDQITVGEVKGDIAFETVMRFISISCFTCALNSLQARPVSAVR
jgi:hypothetical protein